MSHKKQTKEKCKVALVADIKQWSKVECKKH